MGAFGIDYHIPFGQQLVGHPDGGLQRAAPVAAKVEHQVLHTLLVQLQQCRVELGSGGLGKTVNIHITRAAVHHHRRQDRHVANHIATNLHLFPLRQPLSLQFQIDVAETGPAD